MSDQHRSGMSDEVNVGGVRDHESGKETCGAEVYEGKKEGRKGEKMEFIEQTRAKRIHFFEVQHD